MTKYNGMNMTVDFNSGAWADNFVKAIDIDEAQGTTDSSGATDTQETQLPEGVTGATVEVEFWDDTTAATVWTKHAPLTQATLVVKPDGTKTRTGTAIVTKRVRGVAHKQTVPITVTYVVTGGLS